MGCGHQAPPTHPIFFFFFFLAITCFFAISLKNYMWCLLKLNCSLIMHFWETFTETPHHLLFGRQLLCYSNTTSAVIRNLIVLSSTTDKINRISNHLRHRWRPEYVVNLRETQQASNLNINSQKLCCASLWWKSALTLLENFHSNRGIT